MAFLDRAVLGVLVAPCAGTISLERGLTGIREQVRLCAAGSLASRGFSSNEALSSLLAERSRQERCVNRVHSFCIWSSSRGLGYVAKH